MEPVDFFRALADQTRLRCLALIAAEGELCVCELTYAVGEVQPKISRHLAALRKAEVVEDLRRGTWVYYRINPALPAWAREVLARAVDGIAATAPFADDRRTLAAMPNRPDRCAVR